MNMTMAEQIITQAISSIDGDAIGDSLFVIDLAVRRGKFEGGFADDPVK
jgi:hypothetical protein